MAGNKRKKKGNSRKPKRITEIYVDLVNSRYRLGLIINKKGRQDPFLITNNGQEAFETYLEKCNQYRLTPDVKQINKMVENG